MIVSLDNYLAAVRQHISLGKTASRTTIASQPFSVFELAGNPGAGTLAIGNTANGVVHLDTTNGYPVINAFGGPATGYITRVAFGSTVASRLHIYDRIFSAGAYAFNANTTLASQPSFASRVSGIGYGGLELWVEQVTVATGNQAVNVTYTDQDGNTGATTGAIGIGGAPTVGRMWNLPLAAGDSGLMSIQTIVGSVATVGTFNVHVMRPLVTNMRVRSANDGDVLDILKTGTPQIFADSALFLMVQADSTASGIPYCNIEVSNY